MVKYLNPADHNPRRITKTDKEFAKNLDLKNIHFPVKIRDIRQIEKKNSISISVFGYEHKEKHSLYVSTTCCEEKHVDLLQIGEEGKESMFLSKILILSCMIILYIVEENIFVDIVYKLLVQKIMLKSQKVVLKLMTNKRIIMPKKVNMLNSKTMKDK